MKTFKIFSLTLLGFAFYSQGIFSGNSIFIWSGHLIFLFTVIYGYSLLLLRKTVRLSSIGRKTYGIFDMTVTLGLFYFLFYVSYFDRFTSIEMFFMIAALLAIIIGKLVYYLQKEFRQTA